jgi:hypothetical protein
VVKTIKAHAEPVTSIIYSQGKLISGSKDSKIAIITSAGGNFKLEKIVDLGYMALKVPKSIDFYKNNLLLGLRNGSIMEIKNVMDEKSDTKIHMHSHFEGETWGLAVFENKFITSGGDNQILMYDADTHEVIRTGKISEKVSKKKEEDATTARGDKF